MATAANVRYSPAGRGEEATRTKYLAEFMLHKVGLRASRNHYPAQLLAACSGAPSGEAPSLPHGEAMKSFAGGSKAAANFIESYRRRSAAAG